MTTDETTTSMSFEQAMDTTVRPQDDLYRHINGTYLREHEIPADRARDGAFMVLRDLSEKRVREIITDAAAAEDATGEAKQVGDLYASFMAEERIEALGTGPLQPDLELFTAARDKEALARAMGTLASTGVGGAVALFVDTDFNDPDSYRVFLWQSGLGLPDESYYREDAHAETRTAYLAHVAAMLELSGLVTADEAMGAAQRVVDVETRLAAGHWDKVRSREADQINNPRTWAEILESAAGFPWDVWRESLNLPAGAVDSTIVGMPSFLSHFATAWEELDVDSLRMWLLWHVVSARAPYLPTAFVEEHFDFYGRTLTGAPQMRERWKRGVSLVEGALGEAVGKIYVERHFPPAHKARMQELVDNLIEAYRQSITELDWMGEETKRRALEKLAAFTPKIGYPDRWRDYSTLETDPTDLLGNVRRAELFETARNLAKLGEPMDRDEWFMPPQMVNAYYNPTMNEIVFPAAILQPPFFDVDADDAWNYGGIGSVIGHEIGHGFDDQGSKYDGTGRLQDWWTEQDRTEFEARTTALIAQYDAFSPAQLGGSHHVNGALTIGENIGDLGGLSIAIKAYEIALRKQGLSGLADAPVVDGLTGLQRIFFSWGRVWQQKARDAEVVRLLSIDPHSPNEFRCNGVVRNLDAFVEAFDVQPTDALYLPPEERVRIW
ncbi:endothelin-converting enzyme Metallo peptidase. MEROPS family M13 [Georgenia satyanarayanai]|uniref:Endothelin-converting enzyme Metallo peptidase. MEROPS family M13 n=1 Tax=Georgenia satyanarayanai TaxID=860221 RepID=A0A2Y9AQ06_9MICO|nr:M13-type metalloendopeptidase [Georgenia satyanarayanai]PYF96732.1 endothelin-converting enzyme [Georgenia satyanarayanai]SSA46474.1 endothelin-converting enzyme Metallo peptidase. MEROPS family M13 [Georgenia satyanarayanai]